jgi:hypothetical protein
LGADIVKASERRQVKQTRWLGESGTSVLGPELSFSTSTIRQSALAWTRLFSCNLSLQSWIFCCKTTTKLTLHVHATNSVRAEQELSSICTFADYSAIYYCKLVSLSTCEYTYNEPQLEGCLFFLSEIVLILSAPFYTYYPAHSSHCRKRVREGYALAYRASVR